MKYFWMLMFFIYLLVFYFDALLIIGVTVTNETPFYTNLKNLYYVWGVITTASMVSALYRLSFGLKFNNEWLWLIVLINGAINLLFFLFYEGVLDFPALVNEAGFAIAISNFLLAIGLEFIGVTSLVIGYRKSKLVKDDL